MERQPIQAEEFITCSFRHWNQQWFLLSCGDFSQGHYNCMTISWGSLGIIWGRPFAQVVVRPIRFTYEFMEKYPTFTLCSFSEEYRPALDLLGTHSGRNSDKIAASGLTPISASTVAAPIYAQAELTLECRKIYWQDFDPIHFLEPTIENNYPKKDYHRIYYGEILAIAGTDRYIV